MAIPAGVTKAYQKAEDGTMVYLGDIVPELEERVTAIERGPATFRTLGNTTITGELIVPLSGRADLEVATEILLDGDAVSYFEYKVGTQTLTAEASNNSATIYIEAPEGAQDGDEITIRVTAYSIFETQPSTASAVLTVKNVYVKKPTLEIISNKIGEIDIRGDAFKLVNSEKGYHNKSDWILINPETQEVIQQSLNNTKNLTIAPTIITGAISEIKSYLVKVRYHDIYTDSWSEYAEVTFTPTAGDPWQPSAQTQGFHFIAAKDGTFRVVTGITDDTTWKCEVIKNGESIGFLNSTNLKVEMAVDDDILIKVDEDGTFPKFLTRYGGTTAAVDFIKEILEPLPCPNLRGENLCPANVNSLFKECKNLVKISEKLLANFISITSGAYLFQDCTKLTEIPAGILNSAFNVTSLNYMCDGCTSLATIAGDLFKYAPKLTTLIYCFQNTAIVSIPPDLFKNNPEIRNFNYVFYSCKQLTEIPIGLFRYNTKVTSFAFTFSYCTKLPRIIDIDIFKYNLNVTSLEQVLWAAQLKCPIRIGSKRVSTVSHISISTSFITALYVPANSTTATTFRGLGYNVIEEEETK